MTPEKVQEWGWGLLRREDLLAAGTVRGRGGGAPLREWRVTSEGKGQQGQHTL